MTGCRCSAKLIRSAILILTICLWTFAIADNDLPAKSLPGRYAPAEVGTDAKAAAEFAVQEQGKREGIRLALATVVKAEKQIVAGINCVWQFRTLTSVARGFASDFDPVNVSGHKMVASNSENALSSSSDLRRGFAQLLAVAHLLDRCSESLICFCCLQLVSKL
jgi:hypothetical protein